ncbi:lysophospholipid acyltransferase family protein [Salinarimonas soli]|uniref:1-acyl-sn-glycerol-3-phosphate acyltransferase n=1 Tax=Salinarimonas soli TaxID=1638099 RepID=A0A5B2VIV6_9HYPH|nr:lysophospholipid acyltransferase family protein [Salinarimonas soli]KAA2238272.1 1-acyl-sn-glycerol-3-phosphate acyltransferase [Salinarimonas soli]
MIDRLLAGGLAGFARAVTGVRADWRGCAPVPEQRIYYANHASHGDFVLIWSVLPPPLRRATRPVAAADYWGRDALRRYLGQALFAAVLIDRNPAARAADPIAAMGDALDAGSSLILFPEGTRNATDAPLLPFRSGLYHLARVHPRVACVPVWIENVNRVLPKGEFLPLPLLCSVTFGEPLRPAPEEGKAAFLDRARDALLTLAPGCREAP